MPIQKLLSGGQTGVDRAALDVAMALGLPCGGWCPRGRRAEDGPLSPRYPLQETPSDEYEQRTKWNVRDADGTVVITRGEPTEGTALTVRIADRLRKPCLVVDLLQPWDTSAVRKWLDKQKIRTLNVAGPRESKAPGIYGEASTLLKHILTDSL
jgi:hypothetical protein